MIESSSISTCLVYCCLPYNGQGWTETCVNVLSHFQDSGLQPVLVCPRSTKVLPPTIKYVRSLSLPVACLPWRFASRSSQAALDRCFLRLLDQSDPQYTIAYFWPGVSTDVVKYAKARGFLTVREMINGPTGIAKEILDRAYERLGIPAQHSITAQSADEEWEELNIYDFLFASNSCVESSLRRAGLNDARIISTSFGWLPSRFSDMELPRESHRSPFRALFVGTVGVRKGIPELFQAWEKSGVDGELVVVGEVDDSIAAYVRKATKDLRIRMIPFTPHLDKWYRESDIFVLPTLEEGGPQVTLEAAGCGMPIVTTEMGSARLVADGVNGLVVKEGDVEGLANAIWILYKDEGLRRRLAAKAAKDANDFVYKKVSVRRAEQLLDRLRGRSY